MDALEALSALDGIGGAEARPVGGSAAGRDGAEETRLARFVPGGGGGADTDSGEGSEVGSEKQPGGDDVDFGDLFEPEDCVTNQGAREAVVADLELGGEDNERRGDDTDETQLRCFLCTLSSNDNDLTESRPSLVPFAAARKVAMVDPVCDICEGFLRYQVGSRSRVEMQKRLDDRSACKEVIETLSWHMALKALSTERVAKNRLEEQVALSEKQREIFKVLATVRGLPHGGEDLRMFGKQGKRVDTGMHVMGLMDYLAAHGTPLVNRDRIISLKVGHSITLGVLLHKPMEETGRYGSQQAMFDKWRAHNKSNVPEDIRLLSTMKVDDLQLLKALQTIVGEFANMQSILQGFRHSDPVRREGCGASSASSGQARMAFSGLQSNADSSSAAGLAQTRSSPTAAGSTDVGASLVLQSMQPQPLAIPMQSAPRSLCSSTVTPTKGKQPEGLLGSRPSPPSGAERVVEKVRHKAKSACVFFTDNAWTAQLRAKEKMFKNLITAANNAMTTVREAMREDFLEDLERIRDIGESGQVLVAKGKDRPVEAFDVLSAAPHIKRIRSFLDDLRRKSDPGTPVLASNLLKVEASRCALVVVLEIYIFVWQRGSQVQAISLIYLFVWISLRMLAFQLAPSLATIRFARRRSAVVQCPSAPPPPRPTRIPR